MAEPTIKMLWGIAKSPELSLTDEELHLLVEAHTGKQSIRELNRRELGTLIGILTGMKDSGTRSRRENARKSYGNTGTANQRRKIYRLTQALGWEKPARVNGLCKKMFGVERVEWLDYRQCSKLIEALKSMEARQKNENQNSEEQCRVCDPGEQ